MKEETFATESYLSLNHRLSLLKEQWGESIKDFARANGELIVLCILGFWLGRAVLMGQVASFGAVFWLLLLREKPRESYMVAAAVLLGKYTSAGAAGAGQMLGALVAVWLWEVFCLRLWKKKSPLPVSVGMAVLLSSPLITMGLATAEHKAMLGVDLLLGLLASLSLYPAIMASDRLPRIRDQPELIKPEEILSVLLLLTLAAAGLGQLEIGGVSLLSLVCKMLLLCAAFIAGAGSGAAAGVITGMILGLGSPHLYLIMGSLSFSGFWAGFMRNFGRVGTAAGFVFSFPLLALLEPALLPDIYRVDNFLALLLFLLIPPGVHQWVAEKLPAGMMPMPVTGFRERGEKEVSGYVSKKMRSLSGLFSELAGSFNYLGDEQGYTETEMSFLLNEVLTKACRSCVFRRRCWDEHIFLDRKSISGILETAVDDVIEEHHLPAELMVHCRSPAVLLAAVNCSREIWKANHYWVNRLMEERELVSRQLKGVSLLLREIEEEAGRADFFRDKPKMASPGFTVEIGVAGKVGRNQKISGDYYNYFEIGDNLQVLILSDGMGSGHKAREESRAAVGLMERMLETGLNLDMVIRTVNNLLQLRSREEMFATIDLMAMDGEDGRVEIVKIGAAPGYWKRGKEVERVAAASLPMGIIADPGAERSQRSVMSGDLYVMVTDGINGRNGEWIAEFLQDCRYTHPEIVAEKILDEAHYRNGEGSDHDDMTVVTCRFISL